MKLYASSLSTHDTPRGYQRPSVAAHDIRRSFISGELAWAKTRFVESSDLPRPRVSNHVPLLAVCFLEPVGRTAAPLSAPSSHVLIIGHQTVFLCLVPQRISPNSQLTCSYRFVSQCPSQCPRDQAPLCLFEHGPGWPASWCRGERSSRSRPRRVGPEIGR